MRHGFSESRVQILHIGVLSDHTKVVSCLCLGYRHAVSPGYVSFVSSEAEMKFNTILFCGAKSGRAAGWYL